MQRLVCLCAYYSEKDENASEPPTVRGYSAIVEFGLDVTFGMKHLTRENKILVTIDIDEDDVEATDTAAKLVKLLNSMLTALKDEFMGKELIWE